MKKLVFTLLIVLICMPGFSQRKEYHEKIMALKTAFFTQELSLTPEEAQKFWPIYNAFENDFLREKRHQLRAIRGKLKDNFASISEAEASKYIDDIYQIEESILTERKKMMNDLSKVISPKKVLLLTKLEEDFNRKLLDDYRKQKPHD
ncbi:MAG: sensor of ECF-type sigma factor [Bacteroidetes bacterium HGW-Bacteroidetes-13]|jgi:Spy/CpxP family protein refolding chaperone|nr:MAG: sensor of ECF-type sigma factor [Bacteroidetes bacterium HGW-Bacteroidetes-13]